MCGEWGQNQKREGKSRPSGIYRAACLRIVYGLGAIPCRDTKCSIQRCQIITGRRMEKAVQKAAVNWEVNNCVYNWTSDRKTGRFATANEVKSVTSHEVINSTGSPGMGKAWTASGRRFGSGWLVAPADQVAMETVLACLAEMGAVLPGLPVRA